ncbi:MAG: ZIP family metal transporter [Chloroflexi bacterium]|nr:ZIP family metal transporter [Chloroflexota bacterium]
MTLLQILAATLIVSLLSLIGVLPLSLKEKWLMKAVPVLVALAAGALLGGAFLQLIPQAIELSGARSELFLFLLIGFILFFILEEFFHLRHQHDPARRIQPFSYLILISDGMHNFIDGVVIAASFMVSLTTGLAATVAVALHEIPQELGDFGVLVYGGFSRKRALMFNFLSGVTAVIGGVAGYFASHLMQGLTVYLLLLASGHFIYIGAADLIPAIKAQPSLRRSILHFAVFILGIVLMLLI